MGYLTYVIESIDLARWKGLLVLNPTEGGVNPGLQRTHLDKRLNRSFRELLKGISGGAIKRAPLVKCSMAVWSQKYKVFRFNIGSSCLRYRYLMMRLNNLAAITCARRNAAGLAKNEPL